MKVQVLKLAESNLFNPVPICVDCHNLQVTDGSMVMLAGLGVLQRLILRACHSITDRGETM